MHDQIWRIRIAIACALAVAAQNAASAQAEHAERFRADATVARPGEVDAYAVLAVTIDRLATDAEREALIAAVIHGGTAAARRRLETADALGKVQFGATSATIKYACARTTGTGREITIVTAEPIALAHTVADAGETLGLMILMTGESGPGHGELIPSTSIRIDLQGSVVAGDDAARVLPLSNVVPLQVSRAH